MADTDVENGLHDSELEGILTATETLVGFELPAYDYIALSQTSTEDIWTYKDGGAGGTTVGIVTITYTSSAKTTISTVVKT